MASNTPCLQFQTELEEKKDSSRVSGSDELNAEFWKEIKNSLSLAMELLQNMAEQEGIDLDLDGEEMDSIPVGMPSDADGSAKIALIAIDRSIGAWAILHREFPDREDETLKILAELQRLRNFLECEFPEARAFIRPGFDEDVV